MLANKEKLITIDARHTVVNQSAETILKVLQNERVTKALLMAYIMYDVVNMNEDALEKFDLSALKVVWSGGQRMDPVIINEFKTRIPAAFCVVYGQTENILATAMFPSGDNDKQHETAGYGLPNIEIAIKDDSNTIVPINAKGEICTRGYSIFAGYLNNEEKTREALDENGWLHSGDIGTMTPYGYLTLVGRVKDIIKRGAVIVYPGAIERIINEHPSVNQVHVVGVPDPRLYEEVCACIQVHDGETISEAEIKTWCQGVFSDMTADGVSNAPKYYIIMYEIPVLTSGKVDTMTSSQ